MKTVLITGIAGFIGSHLAKRCIAEGFRVVGVDDLSQGVEGNIPKEAEFIFGNLSSHKTICKIPTDCDFVLHLAGQSSGEISFDDPVLDLNKNVITTLNLINFSIKNKVKKFIYASSMSVYGNVPDRPINEHHHKLPLSCYGVGKLAAEGYLEVFKKNLPYISLRMFNVYGPGQDLSNIRQGMVSIFVSQAIRDGKIIVKGSSERYRDFIYIDDVVNSWFSSMVSSKIKNKSINIGTGVRTSVGDLLDKICNLIPNATYNNQGTTPGDQNGIFADVTLLKNELLCEPQINLDVGLKKFIDWAKLNIY